MPLKGYKQTEEHKREISLAKKGVSLSEPHIVNMKKAIRETWGGNKNIFWKGDNVSYRALHSWVVRWLGRPNKCERCGRVGYGHWMHWANLSGNYLRDLSDWIRLCAKCHVNYDQELGLRKTKS